MRRDAITRLALALLAVLVLGACRVDIGVDVVMVENGSGTVTVTAVADAELVAAAPGLADDLSFDDLLAAGWVVEGPASTPDGGLSVVIRHTFSSPEQATALLASLNGTDGPFEAVALSRSPGAEQIDYLLTGGIRLEKGLTSFADPDLLAVVGATPYADRVAAAGRQTEEVLGLTVSVELPGAITATGGTVDDSGRRVRWSVPLDGTGDDLTTTATVSLARGSWWNVLSIAALATLIAWLALSVMVLAIVARARRRRARSLGPPWSRFDEVDPT